MNSEITLQEALFDSGIINEFRCCKIFINNEVLWDDDVDMRKYIRLGEAWEKYRATHLNCEDYKVTKIDIEIVDFHHSIIRVYCEKKEKPIKELKMDRKRIIEALNDIQKQISDGYINFGLFENAEVEVIEQAIKEFKINHGFNNT